MRQIRTSGSMSEGGKRDYGRIEAPPRCESRRTQLLPDPTVTAPVLDSTVQPRARNRWPSQCIERFESGRQTPQDRASGIVRRSHNSHRIGSHRSAIDIQLWFVKSSHRGEDLP